MKQGLQTEQEEKAQLKANENALLADAYLKIKGDFFKKLEGANETEIKFITNQIRNMINNFQRT